MFDIPTSVMLLLQACKGLRNLNATKITLVPIREMTDVLSVESKVIDLARDTWVRIKTGTYKGDLAKVWTKLLVTHAIIPHIFLAHLQYLFMQVVDVDNVRQKVTIKLIPRIDLQALANKLVIRTIFSISLSYWCNCISDLNLYNR